MPPLASGKAASAPAVPAKPDALTRSARFCLASQALASWAATACRGMARLITPLALLARPGCIFGSYPLRRRTLRIAGTDCKKRLRELARPKTGAHAHDSLHPGCRHPQLVELELKAFCGP